MVGGLNWNTTFASSREYDNLMFEEDVVTGNYVDELSINFDYDNQMVFLSREGCYEVYELQNVDVLISDHEETMMNVYGIGETTCIAPTRLCLLSADIKCELVRYEVPYDHFVQIHSIKSDVFETIINLEWTKDTYNYFKNRKQEQENKEIKMENKNEISLPRYNEEEVKVMVDVLYNTLDLNESEELKYNNIETMIGKFLYLQNVKSEKDIEKQQQEQQRLEEQEQQRLKEEQELADKKMKEKVKRVNKGTFIGLALFFIVPVFSYLLINSINISWLSALGVAVTSIVLYIVVAVIFIIRFIAIQFENLKVSVNRILDTTVTEYGVTTWRVVFTVGAVICACLFTILNFIKWWL